MILFLLLAFTEPPSLYEECDTIKSVTIINDSIVRTNYYVKCDTSKVYERIK